MNVQPLTDATRLVTAAGFPTPEFKTIIDQMQLRGGGTKGGVFATLDGSQPAVVWDVDKAPRAQLLLAASKSITAVNLVAGDFRQPYVLRVLQDAAGGWAITWPATFRFGGGTPPTLASGPNQASELWFSSDGSNLVLGGGAINI